MAEGLPGNTEITLGGVLELIADSLQLTTTVRLISCCPVVSSFPAEVWSCFGVSTI